MRIWKVKRCESEANILLLQSEKKLFFLACFALKYNTGNLKQKKAKKTKRNKTEPKNCEIKSQKPQNLIS
jgi:hypothetical protein